MAVPSAETGFYSVRTAVPGAEAGTASSMAVPDEEAGKLLWNAGPTRRGRHSLVMAVQLKKLYRNKKTTELIDLPWLVLVFLQKILGF